MIVANPFQGFQHTFEAKDVLGRSAFMASVGTKMLAAALFQHVLDLIDLSEDGPISHAWTYALVRSMRALP
ncbi:MAG: hypothetical protein EOS81_02910 [Mesorhizobium sp.]|nr:MAG: hypothetical protein EOS81_02910 [Mesorhizobium sp.]